MHIPEASVMAGEDFVKTLKKVPQATIAAKRKLMRKYAPMLDWDCDMEQGCDAGSAAFQASLVASLSLPRGGAEPVAPDLLQSRGDVDDPGARRGEP